MEQTNKLLYLFEELKGKVEFLENALDDINHVKKSLKVTSADVKGHIRDSISRHLEALRNREIWLLSQVELIQNGKEEILSQKQGELLEVVGGMKKVCGLLEQSTEAEKLGEFEIFEEQLNDLIKSVEKLSVAPEETPNIIFSGYNFELLESIREFGRVDCDCESTLSSLVKNMDLSGTSSNKRKFITSSGPMENWLLHGQKCFKFQPESALLSVEKWLTKCNTSSHYDVESEIGCSEKSNCGNQWILSNEKSSKPQDKDVVFGYFNEVKMSGPTSWIKKSTKVSEIPRSFITGETYSKIASLGNENWLFYKQERSKLRNLPEDLGKIHSCEDDDTKWLKRTNKVDCPKTSTGKAFAALATSNTKKWLKPEQPLLKCDGNKDCSNCEKWLLSSSSSSSSIGTENYNEDYPDSLSDADWLKVKKVDVVSIENLDLMFSSCSKSNESSNLPLKQCDRSGVEKYYAKIQAQSDQDWLQGTAPSKIGIDINQKANPMKVFSEFTSSNDYNQWLVKPSGLSSDVCKWLSKSSQERCKNCPKTEACLKKMFPLFDIVKDTSNETWLSNTTQD